MLKCLGFHRPALINNGEDTTPLVFDSARDSETKQKHTPGSLQSGFSPSSTLSSRTSPPIRQPSYADPFSERLRPSNYSLDLQMESVPESTQRLSANGRSTILGERFDSKCVIVAVDATEKLTLGALRYALQNIVNPRDRLYLLGVLHKIIIPKRYKQNVDPTTGAKFGGIKTSHLENERKRKEEEFESAIADHEIQKLFVSKQITLEVVIGTGPDRKVVTRDWAVQLEARWVILDKSLIKDKSYLREHLNCNIVLLKQKNEPFLVKVYQDDSISEFNSADFS